MPKDYTRAEVASMMSKALSNAPLAREAEFLSGKLESDGSITLTGATPGKFWARPSLTSRAPVEVWGQCWRNNVSFVAILNKDNEWEFARPASAINSIAAGEYASAAFTPALNSDITPTNITGQGFSPGRVINSELGGLTVTIEAFSYVSPTGLSGIIDTDLLLVPTATGSMIACVYVLFDPRTGTYSQQLGPDYVAAFTPTIQNAYADLDIDHNLMVMAAVPLVNGATEVTLIYDMRAYTTPTIFDYVNFGVQETQAIATGAITLTKASNYILQAETGTADTLVTITGGIEGQTIELTADAGDTITLDNGGNLILPDSTAFDIDSTKTVLLTSDGTDWKVVGGSGSGGGDSGRGAAVILNVNTTAVGNVGTGEDDLMSFTIPAGTLTTNGDYITIDASFTYAANGNNKNLKAKFDGTNILTTGALALNGTSLVVRGKIVRVSATTYKSDFVINTDTGATTILLSDVELANAGAATWANALVFKFTGEATSNNDIVQNQMEIVQWSNVVGGLKTRWVSNLIYHKTITTDDDFDTNELDNTGRSGIAGYTNLSIIIVGRSSDNSARTVFMYANGDVTAANYANQYVQNLTSTTLTAARADTAIIGAVSPNGVTFPSIVEITLPLYAETTFQKAANASYGRRDGASSQWVGMLSWSWENTAAITRLQFIVDTVTNFETGTQLFIYGEREETIGAGTGIAEVFENNVAMAQRSGLNFVDQAGYHWDLVDDAGNDETEIKLITSEFTTTSTGNIDNLDFSNAQLIRMNNASDATIRGLLAGSPGQRVTIVSVGAGNVYLAHQNGGSSAANQLNNFMTTNNTPLATTKGVATYVYDDTTDKWRMETHDQGAVIAYTPTWTTTGTAPALVNGTLTGSYIIQGTSIQINTTFTAGSSTTFGTGIWRFSTPVSITTPSSGTGLANDATVQIYLVLTSIASATTIGGISTVGTGNITNTQPFAWGNADALVLNIVAVVS